MLDVIAIDERMRNSGGEGVGGWFPSDKEHRGRAHHPYLQELPHLPDHHRGSRRAGEAVEVGASPWSLAQDPHDEWGEVFCTHNEEPDEYKKLKEYETKEKGK